jgi:hypothetical protein
MGRAPAEEIPPVAKAAIAKLRRARILIPPEMPAPG